MTAPERFADSQIPLAPRARPYMTHHRHKLGDGDDRDSAVQQATAAP